MAWQRYSSRIFENRDGVERVEVLWPDGTATHWEDLPANKLLIVRKGRRHEQEKDLLCDFYDSKV
ncbi:MAG: ASPIC/UnbV domain-containing protein [Candidatus Latescibacteria bacterium]|jgi:hypothetical protein|nr:ASPIC/UnbV domain-containing protein [Candidatus Latescibacterota bacterium]